MTVTVKVSNLLRSIARRVKVTKKKVMTERTNENIVQSGESRTEELYDGDKITVEEVTDR